ncbi:MAG TPA: HepT-like ribonuclease domain-containing protein [Parafilimonas sp.]
MRDEISNKVRLYHIIECADEIGEAIKNENFESFAANHVLRIAVVKWIEIIGEAAASITNEFKEEHNEINWRGIIGIRNVVVHEYFGIKYELIWETATLHVPK